MACSAVQYFAPLPYRGYDIGKKNVIETKICVLIFSTTFYKKILILRKIERDIENVF
jgi:hypothetical protein